MSLSGVHIAFGYGSPGSYNQAGQSVLPNGSPTASQTMAATALATIRAPSANAGNQQPLLSISASADIYYITGPNVTLAQVTDGVTARRYYNPATTNGREDIWVQPGDGFAWAPA